MQLFGFTEKVNESKGELWLGEGFDSSPAGGIGVKKMDSNGKI